MVEGPDEKYSEFKLILEGWKLTEKQERTISAALQQTMANHLAEIDYEGDAPAPVLKLAGGNGTHGGQWLRIKPDVMKQVRKFLARDLDAGPGGR